MNKLLSALQIIETTIVKFSIRRIDCFNSRVIAHILKIWKLLFKSRAWCSHAMLLSHWFMKFVLLHHGDFNVLWRISCPRWPGVTESPSGMIFTTPYIEVFRIQPKHISRTCSKIFRYNCTECKIWTYCSVIQKDIPSKANIPARYSSCDDG